jgi:2-oxoglutarate dehydrogenase E2 component (dihydrolipoamide succinyltransferase)
MPIELRVPAVGESITEVEIGGWLKKKGDPVAKDEPVVTLESEKATMELPAPNSGTITEILKQRGEVAKVGEVIGLLSEETSADGGGARAGAASTEKAEGVSPAKLESKPSTTRIMPAAEKALAEHGLSPGQVQPTGPGGRMLKEDVLRQVARGQAEPPSKGSAGRERPASPEVAQPVVSSLVQTVPAAASPPGLTGSRDQEVVPMSRLRRTVAERLVQAQQAAALLTTFNEIDMSGVMALRKEYGDAFQKRYNVKLGFMSFFVKASVDALKQYPAINAEVSGANIVYHNYFDIGVAVGGGKGLVVPVLRNAEHMSFADIELAIADFGQRARENKLKVGELQEGTFTISNGGVYGSLLSTPIVNPPQSGVLGMHAIQERPVARDGAVVIRPMMYVALTYDHRIVDGREAVSFLKRIKDVIENPTRMLMEV